VANVVRHRFDMTNQRQSREVTMELYDRHANNVRDGVRGKKKEHQQGITQKGMKRKIQDMRKGEKEKQEEG